MVIPFALYIFILSASTVLSAGAVASIMIYSVDWTPPPPCLILNHNTLWLIVPVLYVIILELFQWNKIKVRDEIDSNDIMKASLAGLVVTVIALTISIWATTHKSNFYIFTMISDLVPLYIFTEELRERRESEHEKRLHEGS